MMTILAILASLLWLLALGLTVLSARITLHKLKSFPPHGDQAFRLYPVSILKPLKGVDPGLEQNLESFFHLEYPDFELIFSVADERDPAKAVVERLLKRFPMVPARLLVGEEIVGVNPKINNLVRSYAEAANDLVLISDSNIRVSSQYLKHVVSHYDQSVGVVTAVVGGFAPRGLGGYLEAIYLNTFYARGMNLAFFAGKPCVVGKSMLFSRTQAQRFGGLRALGGYIAEDFILGEMMRKLGLQVVMMADPIPQFIGKYSLKDFWSRHLRWGRIRRAQAPLTFMLEPFIGCIASGLLGAFAVNQALGLAVSHVLAGHMALWALCDFLVQQRLTGRSQLWQPVAWFLRELLCLPLWIQTASSRQVQWRGRKYKIFPGGAVTVGDHEVSLGSRHERAPDRGIQSAQ